jgi:hypothetical protein
MERIVRHPIRSSILAIALNITSTAIYNHISQMQVGEGFPMRDVLIWIPSIVGIILLALVLYSVWKRPNVYINRTELRKNRGSLSDELQDCKRVWAISHTCSITELQGILNEIKVERLVLTDPLDDYMMSKLDPQDQDGKTATMYRNQIERAKDKAHRKGAKVRFYSGPIANSLIIADTQSLPRDSFSKESWARLESGIPFLTPESRPSILIRKKGDEKAFEAMLSHFEVVWDRAREPQISGTQTTTTSPTIVDSPKVPSPPQLGINYQKHKIEFDGQVPIITVYAEYRPHGLGEIRIESIELQLLGQRVACLDWKVEKISQDLWIDSDNRFKLPDGIGRGEHDVKLLAFANGEWWSSQPFIITVPEVNS